MSDDTDIMSDTRVDYFRDYYKQNGYADVEAWVIKACLASNVTYTPPLIKYDEQPPAFWALREEGAG